MGSCSIPTGPTKLQQTDEDWERYRLWVMPLFRKEYRFDAFTDKMLADAVRIAKAQRFKIQTVADALYKRRRLSEKDARRICAGTAR
jgi:hypothetical protein